MRKSGACDRSTNGRHVLLTCQLQPTQSSLPGTVVLQAFCTHAWQEAREVALGPPLPGMDRRIGRGGARAATHPGAAADAIGEFVSALWYSIPQKSIKYHAWI